MLIYKMSAVSVPASGLRTDWLHPGHFLSSMTLWPHLLPAQPPLPQAPEVWQSEVC